MNGAPRATNGRLPTRLPWSAVFALLAVTPLVALVLDPDPHHLADEWKESVRSTVALLIFTAVNATALKLACSAALKWFAPSSVPRGLAVCLAAVPVVTGTVWLIPGWRLLDDRLFSEPVVFLVRALILSSAWVSAAWVFTSVWEPRREAALRAQVRALQSRLEPHFLFNALDTMAQLVATDAKTAETMLVRVSELLREVVVLAETPLVPLSRELALVREYLDVAALRFPSLVSEVKEAEPTALVPPACLLPLVENAVLHGAGSVTVEARRDGSVLWLSVTNPVGPPRTGGTHTALKDVGERLALLFGERASLSTERRGDVFHAELRIPWAE